MIRQAQNYLTGAMSSMALIAAAIVAFVLLVSLEAVRDWPFAGLVGDNGSSSTTAAGRPPQVAGVAGPTAIPAPGAPAAGPRAGPGGGAANGTGTGGTGGAPATVDAGRTPTGASAPGSGGGGGSQPADTSSPQPATGGGGSGGGASGSGSGPLSGSPSNTVNGVVHEVTSGAEHATGGAIDAGGAGKTVEGVVEEVAGPESTVGSTVEKTTKSVGGLLGQGE